MKKEDWLKVARGIGRGPHEIYSDKRYSRADLSAVKDHLWYTSNNTMEAIRENCDKESPILDNACGHGRYALKLMQEGYRKVVGIDLDPGFEDETSKFSICKEKANEMGMDKISLVQGKSQDPPFDDNVFEFVLSNFSLMLLPSLEDIRSNISESYRVLKNGGKLYGTTISITTLYYDNALEHFKKRYESGYRLIFLSEEDIRDILTESKLELNDIKESSFKRGKQEEINFSFLAEAVK